MWQAKAHTELTLSPLPATAVGQILLKYMYGNYVLNWLVILNFSCALLHLLKNYPMLHYFSQFADTRYAPATPRATVLPVVILVQFPIVECLSGRVTFTQTLLATEESMTS